LIWYGVDGNFYFYNGSSVQTIVNEQNGEYIRSRISSSAIWTTFMMADQKHNQVWMYYPTTGNQNPTEYVIINPRRYAGGGKPSFTLGTQTRTSAQRPTSVLSRFYMCSTSTQYTAFTNQTKTFSWSAKSAFFYLAEGNRARLKDVQPDFFQSSGNISLTVYGLEGSQGTETDYGTYTVAPSDIRVTAPAAGQLMAFTFAGTSDAMIGSMRLNFEVQGGRTR